MSWTDIIFYFLVIYIIFSIMVFFLINSNIIPNRRFKKYNLGFESAELRYLEEEGVAYWYINNVNSEKYVILLHGFTRNSGKMESRAQIYYELGYNIYFVDNRGHGLSRRILFPSGFQYSWIVKKLIDHEKIPNPLIHGASMGAIAAAYIAQKYPEIPKAIICEALPNNFDNLYNEMLSFMKIPQKPFFWIDWVSRKIVWRMFEGKDAEYILTDIKCPMYLINGKEDKMFQFPDHYSRTVELMLNKPDFHHWLVEGSKHTKMNLHPEYEGKLIGFIKKYDPM